MFVHPSAINTLSAIAARNGVLALAVRADQVSRGAFLISALVDLAHLVLSQVIRHCFRILQSRPWPSMLSLCDVNLVVSDELEAPVTAFCFQEETRPRTLVCRELPGLRFDELFSPILSNQLDGHTGKSLSNTKFRSSRYSRPSVHGSRSQRAIHPHLSDGESSSFDHWRKLPLDVIAAVCRYFGWMTFSNADDRNFGPSAFVLAASAQQQHAVVLAIFCPTSDWQRHQFISTPLVESLCSCRIVHDSNSSQSSS